MLADESQTSCTREECEIEASGSRKPRFYNEHMKNEDPAFKHPWVQAALLEVTCSKILEAKLEAVNLSLSALRNWSAALWNRSKESSKMQELMMRNCLDRSLHQAEFACLQQIS